MLYGKNRRVLKAIRFLCQQHKTTTTLDIAVYLHNHIQTEDLLGCIRHLASAEENYIEIVSEDKSLVTVSLTHKGRHFIEYERASTWQFLRNSILIPIAVSACTALVTIWIERLFKQ